MITLTSDFGASEYVGAMKGVIYSYNSKAVIVDLNHNIRPFDIRRAAYAVYSTYPYFPKATVHVIVVDPGVGTNRRSIILEADGHFFVGPDNGVFSLIEAQKVYEIGLKNASPTFHGRDVFAPAAAKIDLGQAPQYLGREVKGYIKVMKKEVEVSQTIKGEVFCTDAFGNIITSIKKEHLQRYGLDMGGDVVIKLGQKKRKTRFVSTYGDVKIGEFAALINSSDYFEITKREGSAAEGLNVWGGEQVEVSS